MGVTVAICIATHNRRAELERTLAALQRLDPAPDELIVAVDGCTDGTGQCLRDHHPAARLIVHGSPQGSIPSRNEMARACASDVFFSLDDDSYPLEIDAVARVRILFEQRPRLAVAAFPQRTDEFPESLTATDLGESRFVGSYANSSAAIRRQAFQDLGGYPGFFFHMYEEPDFALRCVCAGWEVRAENVITVRHHYTPAQRSELRVHQRHARNELWSVLLRCPAPQLFAVAAFRAIRQFGYACHRGLAWAVREPAWWIACLRGVPKCLSERAPLPWPRYLAWMKLLRTPIADEGEWSRCFRGEAS